MAKTRELLVVMKGAPDDLLKALDRAKRGFSDFGKNMQALGTTLSTAITLPIGAAGAAAVKMGSDFESSMSRVKAISGATGSEFAKLEALARDLGATTKFSATEAADAMGFLAMAGFDTNQIMGALPGVLDMAAAGSLDLGRAADIASNILSGFGLSADQAQRAADVLAKTAASSNTDIEQLGTAMSYVAPVARQLGISMEETAAMIGKLSDAGIQAERAGTGLRGVISSLLAPSGEAAKTLERLGVAVKDSTGGMRPLVDIFDDLNRAGADAGDMVAIFGREAQAAAGVLAGVGKQALVDFTAELRNSEGAAKNMAAIMQDNLAGSWKTFQSAVESLSIAIFKSGLGDWLRDLVDRATGVTRALANANPALLKWGSILAGLLATVGPLLVGLGVFSASLSSISSLLAGTSAPLKAFFGAMSGGATLVKALGVAFPALATAAKAFGAALAAITSPVGLVAIAIGALTTVTLYAFREELAEGVDGLKAYASELATGLKDAARPAVSGIKEISEGVKQGAKDFANYITETLKARDAVRAMVAEIALLPDWFKRLTLALGTGGMTEAVNLVATGFNNLRGKGLEARAATEMLAATTEVTRTVLRGMGVEAEALTRGLVANRGASTGAAAGAKDFGDKVEGAGGQTKAAKDILGNYKEEVDDVAARHEAAQAKIQKWRDEWQKVVDVVNGVPPSLAKLKDSIDDVIGRVLPATDAVGKLAGAFPQIELAVDPATAAMYDWEIALRDAGVESKRVAEEDLEALRQKLELVRAAYDAGKVSLETLNAVQDEYNKALGVTVEKQSALDELGKRLKDTFLRLGEGLVDVILGAQTLGEVFINTMKAIAQEILDTVVKGALEVMWESIKNNTTAVSGLIDKFKDFFGLFGSAPSAPGGAPTGPAGPGGVGPGGPGGGIGGVINVVTGIVQAIAAIFNAFTLKRIENDIAKIEVTTRETKAETMNRRTDAWDQHNVVLSKWDMAVQALWNILDELKKGLGVNLSGGTLNFKFPPEIAERLADILAEARLSNGTLEKIRDWTQAGFLEQQITSGLLRQMVAVLGNVTTVANATGPLAAAAGGAGFNIVINTQARNGEQLAQELSRALERRGLNRTGAESLGFNFGG